MSNEASLEQQLEFKKRRDRANKMVDELLKKEEIGLSLQLDYRQDAIVPVLRMVDMKQYGKPEPELANAPTDEKKSKDTKKGKKS